MDDSVPWCRCWALGGGGGGGDEDEQRPMCCEVFGDEAACKQR
jgi:hypothetical protein